MTGLTIAVIGAGMGGLAAAAYLARAGHRVSVFDRFEAPAPVGSGLVVQPVGQAVLRDLGALKEAEGFGAPISSMRGREVVHGRRVLEVTYGATPGLAMHRASLFHVLMQVAERAGATLTPAAEVTAIEGQSLRIGGRLTGLFDLIVNASGAQSRLSPIRTRALPYGAIWGTVPWPAQTGFASDELQQRYRFANRMIGILPIGRLPGSETPRATVFWSLPREGFAAWRQLPLEDWKSEVLTFWPEVAPFLEGINAHDDMIMARYSHGALLRPVSGRVVHIGDAAHQTSPQLGQGANMALLDAMALDRALRDPDLDMALWAYRRARRAHVWFYQLLSAAFTPQYQSDSRVLPVIRDRLLFPVSQTPPVPRLLTRLVRGNFLPPLGSLSDPKTGPGNIFTL